MEPSGEYSGRLVLSDRILAAESRGCRICRRPVGGHRFLSCHVHAVQQLDKVRPAVQAARMKSEE